MPERLLGSVNEVAALDGLHHRQINYDPARAPQDGRPEGHWHVDSSATVIGQEPPGPPVPSGPWQTACQLVSQYEFADGPILRAVYRGDQELLGRDMLLEGGSGGCASTSVSASLASSTRHKTPRTAPNAYGADPTKPCMATWSKDASPTT